MANKARRIVIAAGGTGGHIYPAMGVGQRLLRDSPGMELLFVAGGLSTNKFFDRNQFSFRSIESGTFTGKSFLQAIGSCRKIFGGFRESRRILKEYSPDLVIGFGSYHALPVLMAARFGGYPIVLHEQNSKPGKVIRLFSKKALLTGIYFPSLLTSLQGKMVQLAMPLREGYTLNHSTKEQACNYFNLEPSKITILIFGGSQGAHFINQIAPKSLQILRSKGLDFQVLHFTGHLEKETEIASFYEKASIKAVVKGYESRMDFAWRASDFMISRSGAGTIAEQLEFEVPGILIPFPYAADNHQESNADFLVHIGGGWKYQEKDLLSEDLSAILDPLLQNDSVALREKKEHLKNYKLQSCRQEFSTIIQNLLEDL